MRDIILLSAAFLIDIVLIAMSGGPATLRAVTAIQLLLFVAGILYIIRRWSRSWRRYAYLALWDAAFVASSMAIVLSMVAKAGDAPPLPAILTYLLLGAAIILATIWVAAFLDFLLKKISTKAPRPTAPRGNKRPRDEPRSTPDPAARHARENRNGHPS